MKILIHIFCFAGDADLLPICIRAARRAFPGASVHLVDDAANPIPAKALRDLGDVHYQQSAWERNGNLNGPECIRGILSDMHANAALYHADYIVKLDPDTIVVRGQRYLDLMAKGVGQITQTTPEKFFGGMMYILRSDILETCLENAMTMQFPDYAQEDNTIGCLANIACHTGLWVVEDGTRPGNGGRTGGFSFERLQTDGGVDLAYVDEVVRDLDLVNIGTHHKKGLPAWTRNIAMNAVWQGILRSDAPEAPAAPSHGPVMPAE